MKEPHIDLPHIDLPHIDLPHIDLPHIDYSEFHKQWCCYGDDMQWFPCLGWGLTKPEALEDWRIKNLEFQGGVQEMGYSRAAWAVRPAMQQRKNIRMKYNDIKNHS